VDPSQRLFVYRAGRALVLGVLAMAAAAWLISLPAVLGALAGGVVPAALAPRARRPRRFVTVTLACAALGALAASYIFGTGAPGMRLARGLVAALAGGPWLVVVGFVRWTRARAVH
jgi:hypothetical protein